MAQISQQGSTMRLPYWLMLILAALIAVLATVQVLSFVRDQEQTESNRPAFDALRSLDRPSFPR
ncbi:MAG: hypothetical protein ACE5HK_03460 [Candidatus Methylomirabilales bacterium]